MALRDGWTTGSTATAAVIAALHYSVHGQKLDEAFVPLPPGVQGEPLRIPITAAGDLAGGIAWGSARKFAGDDPDATDGMLIKAELYAAPGTEIKIDGGEGIGRVTMAGLAIPPGEAAINPDPRRQITAALRNLAPNGGFKVIISAPEGIARAKATMNERLGILGGISILGTQGVVKPFSNAAWRASLTQFAAVNKAAGQSHIAFATGRRSLNLLERAYPYLPSQAFMVAGDFVADALALGANFEAISWGCFFGKLIKLAQGHANTHAHASELDLAFLAEATGMPGLAAMATAQEALEAILSKNPEFLVPIMRLAGAQAGKFAGKKVHLHLFHMDGRELASL